MSEYVRFNTNIPEEVALRFADGKQVQSRIEGGADQMMYSLAGERVMYLPLHVAERIRELNIGPGQRFTICKAEVKNGNRHGVQWQVSRVDPDPRLEQPSPAPRPEPAPDHAKVNGAAASVQGSGGEPVNGQSTTPANGHAAVNGNVRAPATPLMQVQFGDAMQEFLVLAGRASHNAEVILGTDGASVRFDSRDIAATATSMFIEAARRGSLIWTPGGLR